MKSIFLYIFYLIPIIFWGQCGGNFGEPVFTQDFGLGAPNSYGLALPPGTTTYNYRTFGTFPDLVDGEYTIATSPSLGRPEWHNTTDHSGQPGGYQMVVNAAFEAGEFFRERVTGLCTGQYYQFSFWVLNALPYGVVNNAIPVNVGVILYDGNGNVLNQTNTGNINSTASPVWNNYTFEFQLPSDQDYVDIVLVNNGNGGGGNDLAIDDIQLRPCQSGNFNINTSDPIFSTGVYGNQSNIQITLDVSSSNYNNPYFILQQSDDSGSSWNTIDQNGTGTFTLAAGTYQDGTQYRILVSEQQNAGNANCSIIAGPYTAHILDVIETPEELEECDDDTDGITTFYFQDLIQELLQNLNQANPGNEDVVYIANSSSGVGKIVNVSTQPQYESVCNTNFSLFEIAVDQGENIYVSSNSAVYQFNESACNYDFVADLPTNSNYAMSFDSQNNLYAGGSHSRVYRANNGDFSNFYLWHDFGSGESGGDFVTIGEFMYIAWKESGQDVLYKITLDDDNQFVSYENLGSIENNTYGLAAENGRLYGVTPNYLYEIDLNNLQTRNVINNPTSTPWYGAAGLHEAIQYVISIHETLSDAQQNQNDLGNSYTNTTPFQQQIFIRVENTETGNVQIIPLNLTVNIPPEANDWTFKKCTQNNQVPTFDLESALPNMISDLTDIDFSFYLNSQDAENGSNPITNYNSFTPSSVPYEVFVVLANEHCSTLKILTLDIESAELNITSPQSFCEGGSVVLDATGNFNSYQWTGLQGVDATNNDATSPSVEITIPGTYTITVTYGTENCELSKDIEVTEEALPTFSDQTYEACSDTNEIQITVNDLISFLENIDNQYNYELFNQGQDLETDTPLTGNLTLQNGDVLMIKIKNNVDSDCYSSNLLNIVVHPNPVIGIETEYPICEGETLNLTFDSSYSYQWSGLQSPDLENNNINSNEVNLTLAGNYSVEVDNGNCIKTYEFEVIYKAEPLITDIIITGNTVQIIANVSNQAEYSINGIDWQSSNTFVGLENNIYTAYVRDPDLCGTASQEFTIFNITNFISPNGDGYNDIWQINGLQNYPNSTLRVFDRYGKLLFTETSSENTQSFTWNGTYNGRKLPTGTYWYMIQIADGRTFSGHLTVKNH